MRALVLIGLMLGAGPVAIAGGPGVPAAYRHAAQAHRVPPVMLYALSLTESAARLSFGRRPWPWTLNVAGTPHRYTTRAAACGALHRALRRTRIVDVGLAQLNVHWQPQLFGAGQRFAEPCDALNPYANLDAAAALLYRCHRQHPGSWIAAAGCYHRPAGGRPAARYRRAYRRQLASIDAGVSAPPSTGHTVASVNASGPGGSRARVTWINPTLRRIAHALD